MLLCFSLVLRFENILTKANDILTMFRVFVLMIAMIPSSMSQQLFDGHITAPPVKDTYEFWFDVEMRLTMAQWADQTATPLFFNVTNGHYYKYANPSDGNSKEKITLKSKMDDVIVGDGLRRTAIVVNGSLPGPTMTIYQNSTVIVHVRNLLPVDEVSIHWHGLDMKNFFFMDGVARVSLCPIQPGETFLYKFYVPDHPGTYFYHGHAGPHRSDGLWGALIVLPRPPPNSVGMEVEEAMGVEDSFLIINDWYPHKAQWYYDQIQYDGVKFSPGWMNTSDCYFFTKNLAGQIVGLSEYHSALVNGRGWHNMRELETANHLLPLYRVNVSSANEQRLRIINSGMSYAFRVSIDGHLLRLVAVDAFEIVPVIAHEVIVSPGERYDVILLPQVKAKGAFRIRVQTTEGLTFSESELEPHYNTALLIYDNALPTRPVPKLDRNCTTSNPCVVVNCPFKDFPAGFGYSCINIQDLETAVFEETFKEILQPSFSNGFQEHLLNFRFEEHVHAVNGIQNIFPIVPPFLFPDQQESAVFKSCNKTTGQTSWDSCTHIIDLQLGNVVQLVIYSKGDEHLPNSKIDPTIGFGHPFHLHGHHFHVVKQGITHKLDEQFVKHEVSEFSMEWNPNVELSSACGCAQRATTCT